MVDLIRCLSSRSFVALVGTESEARQSLTLLNDNSEVGALGQHYLEAKQQLLEIFNRGRWTRDGQSEDNQASLARIPNQE